MSNQDLQLLGKSNDDGSFSVRIPAQQLVETAFVDFYDEKTGAGYQRWETLRERRGREVEAYIARCVESGMKPRLFEMTANVRLGSNGKADQSMSFEKLDDDGTLGILSLEPRGDSWLSLIDGGTRLLGIEKALSSKILPPNCSFDVRLFVGLSIPEEIAMFLLINEKQKRVRTDLGVRVVQRRLDEGNLSDSELKTLETVVPETDAWRYEASRIGARLNTDNDSPWKDLIQMPGDHVTKPLKLQAFWTSLKVLLTDEDLKVRLERMESDGHLRSASGELLTRTEFLIRLLKNFWSGVAQVNPDAFAEPGTTVLWGSIGVAGCHIGLAPVVSTILASPDPSLSQEKFEAMLSESIVADYDFWFSKGGSLRAEYPDDKGEAPKMTGAAGYSRLAKMLERDWRSALHERSTNVPVRV